MTKKDTHLAEAERMYVIEQMTINEVASKLNLGEKTLRLWKDQEKWEEN